MASPAPRITVGATDGTVLLPMSDITISGAGSGAAVGSISLAHGAGTLELDGHPVPAAVYVRQAFNTPAGDSTLYQTMAVEAGRIWLLWLYCDPTSGNLTTVFYEATDGTSLTQEIATGTCMDADTSSHVAVQFPAIDLSPPPLITGYTVQGTDVSVEATGEGSVTFGATTLRVFVFGTVDCTGKKCAASAADGWTELHSLLWDQPGGRACFGIFYLRTSDPSHVQVAYSLTLPDLTDPAGNMVLPATWTLP